MTGVEQDIRHKFADAGVRGWLHARPLTGPTTREVSVDADVPVVMASVYKLPLLVAFCRLVDEGDIDPREPVEVPVEGRTLGPTGLSAFRDPVTMSWRDLACSMVTVSDNTAADVILKRVGLPWLERTLRQLGLSQTTILSGTAEVHQGLAAQTNTDSFAAAFSALTSNDHDFAVSAYDPALASSTTPREMTLLLRRVWSNEAASPAQCEFARELLFGQAWQHRLRSGFPYDGVRVAGKTGTLGAVRNEVGVVQFHGEAPVAVAVFTHAARADAALPLADRVIGDTARLAVTRLRSGRI